MDAALRTPFGRRFLRRAASLVAVGIGLLLILFGATMNALTGDENSSGIGFEPSALAVADIPPPLLPVYVETGLPLGIDWAVLAAIGKIETDHGRSDAPGVKSGVNAHGCCAGPMQFNITGPRGGTWGAYGVDGDKDGDKDVYDPLDAIPAAAKYLKASGAPEDYKRAIFAYNHASWYVADVLAQAEKYRGALLDAAEVPQLPDGRANAGEVLALADGPRPPITLTAAGRSDLQTGKIDSRVTSLLVAIADPDALGHRIVVTSLQTGHSYLTSSGNPSNHAFGRAADISIVDGQVCDSTSQGRSGPCWNLARKIAAVKGPLHPTELIYGIDPDGPSGPGFAMSDHTDHIHFGWEAK